MQIKITMRYHHTSDGTAKVLKGREEWQELARMWDNQKVHTLLVEHKETEVHACASRYVYKTVHSCVIATHNSEKLTLTKYHRIQK